MGSARGPAVGWLGEAVATLGEQSAGHGQPLRYERAQIAMRQRV